MLGHRLVRSDAGKEETLRHGNGVTGGVGGDDAKRGETRTTSSNGGEREGVEGFHDSTLQRAWRTHVAGSEGGF